MDVSAIRIGSCFESPAEVGARGLVTWLSPDDCARLFEACLSASEPAYRLLWGVSDNTRRIFSLAEAEALGYRSVDDAERFAGDLPDARLVPGSADAEYVGGGFCFAPLGEPNPL
jgi:hypothetical protein